MNSRFESKSMVIKFTAFVCPKNKIRKTNSNLENVREYAIYKIINIFDHVDTSEQFDLCLSVQAINYGYNNT